MAVKALYLLPHPPIVVPEVGRGEEEKIRDTKESLLKVGKEIGELSPTTIILITPHGPMFQDAISLSYGDKIKGSLENFGVPEVSIELPINKDLTDKIYRLAYEDDISVVLANDSLLKSYDTKLSLDHGAIVPLYFINKFYSDYKIVHITYAPLSDTDLYKFGMVVNRAVEEIGEDVVIIASGDLSHRLKEDGPYSYSPYGKVFDREFLKCLQNGDVTGIFNMNGKIIKEAGECGRRSVLVGLGAIDGKNFKGDLFSYEGTFGVGYGVMKFDILSQGNSKLPEIKSIEDKQRNRRINSKNPYVRLARESLTTYITTGKVLKELPDYVTEEMKNTRRGVFVSLKKHGELRGCIGTIYPTTDSVAEEIIRNAIEAGVNDPRFFSVGKEELLDIEFSVDVLTEPERCTKEDLNPKEYGVIVKRGSRVGLLLPDLEGVDTVEEQLAIALRKADINPDEEYTIERFKVIRHREE